MKVTKIESEASMLGLGRTDTDKIVKLSEDGKLPPKAWFRNFRVATPTQRTTILTVLRETV